jgi:asparagine synthase (glutamine-hydrolysing)
VYKFISLIWNSKDGTTPERASHLARRIQSLGASWTPVYQARGIITYHSGERPNSGTVYRLPNDSGVILGKLFSRSASRTDSNDKVLRNALASEDAGTAGRFLIDKCWGRYVAFLHDSTRNTHYIIRDPSAAMPCFWVMYGEIRVYFSHLQDISALELVPLSINWRYVSAHLAFQFLRLRETGLNEVKELLAGECDEISGDSRKTTFYWDPFRISRTDVLDNACSARDAIRETTDDCVRAWASCYDTIIHELSGGLDSSIVGSSLRRAGTKAGVVCLNLYTDRPEGNELEYARHSARACNFELLERQLDPSKASLRRMLEIPKLPAPYFYILNFSGFDEIYREVARERQADAFFSGQGGDHLFHQFTTTTTAADYVYLHGIGPGLLSALVDTARLTQAPAWSVFRDMIRYGLLRRKSVAYKRELDLTDTFLSSDVLRDLERETLLHPWLLSSRGIPPAKFGHLADLVGFQSFYFPFGRAEVADVVYPLASQPLMELCLRIPMYLLIKGGRDRALARDAFADDVPPSIIGRRTKGDVTTYFNRLLAKDLDLARELLLEGSLAANGLVNRAKLEKHLTASQVVRGDRIVALMSHLVTEAWAQSWTAGARRAAA